MSDIKPSQETIKTSPKHLIKETNLYGSVCGGQIETLNDVDDIYHRFKLLNPKTRMMVFGNIRFLDNLNKKVPILRLLQKKESIVFNGYTSKAHLTYDNVDTFIFLDESIKSAIVIPENDIEPRNCIVIKQYN